MGRQGAAVRPATRDALLALGRNVLLDLGLALGFDLLDLLEAELQLFLWQAFRAASKPMPLQLLDNLAQPLALRSLRQQHRLEQVGVVRQGCGACHMPSESRHRPACDGF